MSEAGITLSGLTVHYGVSQALQGVDLLVGKGTCTAVVGESGSGKTTLGRAVSQLLPPSAIVGGRVSTSGRVAYMPQDAVSALNPLKTVAWQIRQVLKHHGVAKPDWYRRSTELLADAGVPDPDRLMGLYPHELSGGLAQRAVLATVLATKPTILVADEPTSALDVSTQARVLDKFHSLVQDRGITLLIITHDLRAAARLADQVAVLYDGRIVERERPECLLARPAHPYAQALVEASTVHTSGATHGTT